MRLHTSHAPTLRLQLCLHPVDPQSPYAVCEECIDARVQHAVETVGVRRATWRPWTLVARGCPMCWDFVRRQHEPSASDYCATCRQRIAAEGNSVAALGRERVAEALAATERAPDAHHVWTQLRTWVSRGGRQRDVAQLRRLSLMDLRTPGVLLLLAPNTAAAAEVDDALLAELEEVAMQRRLPVLSAVVLPASAVGQAWLPWPWGYPAEF